MEAGEDAEMIGLKARSPAVPKPANASAGPYRTARYNRQCGSRIEDDVAVAELDEVAALRQDQLDVGFGPPPPGRPDRMAGLERQEAAQTMPGGSVSAPLIAIAPRL